MTKLSQLKASNPRPTKKSPQAPAYSEHSLLKHMAACAVRSENQRAEDTEAVDAPKAPKPR